MKPVAPQPRSSDPRSLRSAQRRALGGRPRWPLGGRFRADRADARPRCERCRALGDQPRLERPSDPPARADAPWSTTGVGAQSIKPVRAAQTTAPGAPRLRRPNPLVDQVRWSRAEPEASDLLSPRKGENSPQGMAGGPHRPPAWPAASPTARIDVAAATPATIPRPRPRLAPHASSAIPHSGHTHSNMGTATSTTMISSGKPSRQ
jgi:hypothetical protein